MASNAVAGIKGNKAFLGAVGLLTIVYALNWLAVTLGYRPFLYCGLMNFSGFFEGWWFIVRFAAVAWFAYAFWRASVSAKFQSFVVVVLVFGAPAFFDTIFRLGGTCG